MIKRAYLSQRIWQDVQQAQDTPALTRDMRRGSSRKQICLVLACGLIAATTLAVLPVLGIGVLPVGAAQNPQIVIYPPWMSAEGAFRSSIAAGDSPIREIRNLPLGMTGIVVASSPDQPGLFSRVSFNILTALGCLSLPPSSRG